MTAPWRAPSAATALGTAAAALLLLLRHSVCCSFDCCVGRWAIRPPNRLVCSFGDGSRSLPRVFGHFDLRLPVAACGARCARQAAWSLGVVRGKRWSLRNAPNPAGPFTPRTVVGTAVQHCLMSEASVHRQCLMSEALVHRQCLMSEASVHRQCLMSRQRRTLEARAAQSVQLLA